MWTSVEAQKLLAFTKSTGGDVAAAELFNEPTIAAMGGAPPGYDAATFGRDIAAFRAFAKTAAPQMLIVGPGSAGEGVALVPTNMPMLKSVDLLAASPAGAFDVFSYHYYGAASERCATAGSGMAGTTQQAALSEAYMPMPSERYTLRAHQLDGTAVRLNGRDLSTTAAGALPAMRGESLSRGPVILAPASITFLAIPDAENRDCL